MVDPLGHNQAPPSSWPDQRCSDTQVCVCKHSHACTHTNIHTLAHTYRYLLTKDVQTRRCVRANIHTLAYTHTTIACRVRWRRQRNLFLKHIIYVYIYNIRYYTSYRKISYVDKGPNKPLITQSGSPHTKLHTASGHLCTKCSICIFWSIFLKQNG